MNKLFAILSTLALALPASATPVRLVVKPYEPMVVVPGLEKMGPSRISTVLHCQNLEGLSDWRSLATDSDLSQMEDCLAEHI